MKSAGNQEPSGKGTSGIVSVVGLALVWGIVWANLPSRDELFSAQPSTPVVQELDLTIPGITAAPSESPVHHRSAEETGTIPPQEFSNHRRARQITEMKCEAEMQQVCPDSLQGDDRRQCMAQRMTQFPPACQHIVRQRMVRWKDAESHRFACAEDLNRVCAGVEPGEGRIVQCLQEHAQEISEPCYQSLPKGRLLLGH